MIYSVYNYGTKSYDYYDDGRPGPTHATVPPIATLSGLGASPESAAWPLPSGAAKVGSGAMPRGRIASLDGFRASDKVRLGAVVLSAYLVWRYLR